MRRFFKEMKIAFLPILFLSVVSFSVLPAQNRMRPPLPGQPEKEQTHRAAVFNSNYSIRLHGKLHTGEDVDISALGVGPAFQISIPMGERGLLSCEYNVIEREGVYFISYTVAAQVAVKLGTSNYEFREHRLEGNTICELGSSVEIFKNGEEALSLSLAEAAKTPKS